MAVLANDGPARRPSARRLGALAALTPIAMYGTWNALSGWGGSTAGFIVASTQIVLGAIVAGWIVGGILGRSVARHLLAVVAYGSVAYLVLLPLNVLGATWADVQSGRASDLTAIVVAASGYLLYGVATAMYVTVFLLPFGAAWVATFVLLRRVFGR
jgi:hypothetical protein